jgi:hypothetical protein
MFSRNALTTVDELVRDFAQRTGTGLVDVNVRVHAGDDVDTGQPLVFFSISTADGMSFDLGSVHADGSIVTDGVAVA